MNYASSGIGSPQFVTMELLKLDAKIDLVHVPYKDAPSMFRGMLTGEVQAQIQPLQTAAPQVANGNARMVAVMSAERAPAFPDVPTMRDLGYPNFVVETWYGDLRAGRHARADRGQDQCRDRQHPARTPTCAPSWPARG